MTFNRSWSSGPFEDLMRLSSITAPAASAAWLGCERYVSSGIELPEELDDATMVNRHAALGRADVGHPFERAA
jgi:hypothetical protein